MKAEKLKLTELKDLPKLYKRLGAITKDNRQAFVSYVYISPKAEQYLMKVTRQAFKKEYPYISKRALDSSVGMYLLNLSPRCLKGLPDNLVIVDDEGIEEELKSHGKL